MKWILSLGAVLLIVAVTAFTINIPRKSKAAVNNGFAIVELFTSEGCSSCPLADESVAKLLGDNNSNVYVLGFHVDYWNRLGWQDAYSSHSYSQRQQQYAAKLGSDIYTPQAIVNGTVQFTGSDAGQLHTRVQEGLTGKAGVVINISAESSNGHSINVSYNLPDNQHGILNIALVQAHAQSNVQKGENTGRVLHHVNVMRDFKTVTIKQQAGSQVLTLPAGLSVKDCSIIAYTQDDATWKITGAAQANIK